jgi:hypothetical protein
MGWVLGLFNDSVINARSTKWQRNNYKRPRIHKYKGGGQRRCFNDDVNCRIEPGSQRWNAGDWTTLAMARHAQERFGQQQSWIFSENFSANLPPPKCFTKLYVGKNLNLPYRSAAGHVFSSRAVVRLQMDWVALCQGSPPCWTFLPPILCIHAGHLCTPPPLPRGALSQFSPQPRPDLWPGHDSWLSTQKARVPKSQQTRRNEILPYPLLQLQEHTSCHSNKYTIAKFVEPSATSPVRHGFQEEPSKRNHCTYVKHIPTSP